MRYRKEGHPRNRSLTLGEEVGSGLGILTGKFFLFSLPPCLTFSCTQQLAFRMVLWSIKWMAANKVSSGALGGIINPQTLKTRVFSFEIGYLRILEEGLSDISSKAGSRHGRW